MNKEHSGVRHLSAAKEELECARREMASLGVNASASRAERAAYRLQAAQAAVEAARSQLLCLA